MNSKHISIVGALMLAGAVGCASTKSAVNSVGGARLVGNQIEIDEHVKFASGQATILEESYGLLDSVAKVLKHNPGIAAVIVEGHTDKTGDPAFNQDLSERRAQSVVDYLQEKGVSKEMSAKGFGQEQPLCEDATADCHAKNRRVEFIVEKGS